jgi:transcriptional antiterminator NusG
MHWYVIQVFSGQEKKIKKALEEHLALKGMTDFILEIVVPTERVSEVKNGKQQIIEKKIWPGYILLKMILTDEAWSYVKNTNGVIEFLGGAKPTALSDIEIKEILSDLQSKKETVTLKHKFEVGSSVKIIDGVFVNFMGTVTGVDHEKGRLNLLVSIFGRDTPVDDLEFAQVEEMRDEIK